MSVETSDNRYEFPLELQAKIERLKAKRKPIQLGSIKFDSPLLLAPMSAICNRPYRLLMEDLGAGGTVSELISCHGINYGNEKTLSMLKLDPKERNIGLQLFGEDPESMAKSAIVAQEHKPKFIDINMGCPVRKVVTKGGGSALLRDIKNLVPYLKTIKGALNIPLTIKIRMGWDADQINAEEIIHIAKEEGVEFVAIHGRTRAQQYTGQADWGFIEDLATKSPLPLIGNGDLHQAHQATQRMNMTKCDALMLGRGALRNPFIFLEAYDNEEKFYGRDYWEVVKRYRKYCENTFTRERMISVQVQKMVVWFAAGFPNTAKFRGQVFKSKEIEDVMKISEDYFLSLGNDTKHIDFSKTFMAGGHG